MDSNQGGSASDGSAGAPSVAESAICESIPSTPETMADNIPPRFPGIRGDDGRGDDNSLGGWPRLRKLSKDSGTELEEQFSCDEQTQHGCDDLATTLTRGLEHATTDISDQTGSAVSANTMDMSSVHSGVITAPKRAEIQSSLSKGYSGSHGNGSDMANSSSSTTPTNSIDITDATCNNNNTSTSISNANCQNQSTYSNSNRDLQNNSHGNALVSSSIVTSQGWDAEDDVKGAENFQAVFNNLASSPTVTEVEDGELTSVQHSAGADAHRESVTQEVLVVAGPSTS